MKRAILLILSIQIIFAYSQTTTPQPGGDAENKGSPKHATSNKSFFDLPASNDTRLLPGELNNGISTGYTDFSNDDIDDIVRQHNLHRANTKPSAADMKHMVSFCNFLIVLQLATALVQQKNLNFETIFQNTANYYESNQIWYDNEI